MDAVIVGQKFSIGKTRVVIADFPAKDTYRFDVRINGRLAGSIIALVTLGSDHQVKGIDGFYIAGRRRETFATARQAATALAQDLAS